MRHAISTLLIVSATLSTATAHDLFFRLDAYRVPPGALVVVPVLSGTFSRSENGITRDRLADVSLVGPGGARGAIGRDAWSERDPRSDVTFKVPEAGTYVLGAAIRPRLLALKAPQFNAYLEEEGIRHVLEARRKAGRLAEPSRERYSKYIKALLQAGASPTATFSTVLGYAAEIVPLENPYDKRAGEVLRVRCLVKGGPLRRYVVFAGGRKGSSETRIVQQRLVTDDQGVAEVRLTDAGRWYVKFVHMEEVSEPDVAYESRWATLSFGIQ